MKSPLFQLLLITTIVGVGLWTGIKWFLQGTHEYSTTLNSQSLSYLREDPAATEPADPKELETLNDTQSQPAATATSAPAESDSKVDNKVKEPAGENEQEAEESLNVASQEEDAVRFGEKEMQERENARLERLAALGLVTEKQPEPTVAIDASLLMPAVCEGAALAQVPVNLKFRHESPIIRGESLNALESLVAMYRECREGEFVLVENPLGHEDATASLTQMRFDEVKYFFIQHSVSMDAVQFPEIK